MKIKLTSNIDVNALRKDAQKLVQDEAKKTVRKRLSYGTYNCICPHCHNLVQYRQGKYQCPSCHKDIEFNL